MTSNTEEENEFLSQCEEEFKDRYTEKDKEFMKVFNAKPSTPPIVEPWRAQNFGRRRRNRDFNDRRGFNDRDNYNRTGNDREFKRPRYNNEGYGEHSYQGYRTRY